ncbi:hypothetical protein BS50DRAFT_349495 [Corynespora cassiicola Philippines]|uniref:Chromo domain-containing protein n=1 Tax=Corynespora cassiicola Philippines TaxID=1448308 RepID=A0A2T2NQY1_CORCC|nr:hypothetical protein BS50DRAFT_349495 [Corynespora cassiicola Philippines]
MDLEGLKREYSEAEAALTQDEDTDAVSITSTVRSDEEELDKLWEFESIVAETREDNGETRYIVKWSGYPYHRCTAEPLGNFEDPVAIELWNSHKSRMGIDVFQELNDEAHALVYNLNIIEAERKKLRKAKRAKKRAKLAALNARPKNVPNKQSAVSPKKKSPVAFKRELADASREQPDEVPLTKKRERHVLVENDDETSPSIGRRESTTSITQATAQVRIHEATTDPHDDSIFYRKTQAPRKPPLEQSDFSDLDYDTNDVADSVSKAPVPTKVRRKSTTSVLRPNVGRPTSNKRPIAKKSAVKSVEGSRTKAGAGPSEPNRRTSSSTVSSHHSAPTSRRSSVHNEHPALPENDENTAIGPRNAPTRRAATSKTSQVEEGPAPSALAKRTGGIKIVNEPKQTKASWRNSEKPYGTLKFRYNAVKRSRQEGTPDADMLCFLNPPPPTTAKAQAASTKRHATRSADDGVYGRRDTSRRRVQQEAPQAPPAPKSVPNKILLTCWEWRNNSCEYTSETCRFHHEDVGKMAPTDGSIPPKLRTPPLTCWHWFRNTHGCYKTGDDCDYAHGNTGWVGRPGQVAEQVDKGLKPASQQVPQQNQFLPPNELTCYFWYHLGKCGKGKRCAYKHYDTGKVANSPLKAMPSAIQSQKRVEDESEPMTIVESSSTEEIRVGSSPFEKGQGAPMETSSDADLTRPPTMDTASASASAPTRRMNQMIEQVCNLNYAEMFQSDYDVLQPNAFLAFHPELHVKEIELLTRWLIMQHVQVYNFWFDGAWDSFKTLVLDEEGTGIIITHPDYEDFSEIPEFGKVLRKPVRLFSVGYQHGREYDAQLSTFPPVYRYDCISIFPHGGIIYITDDVFLEQPMLAYRIIELFSAKIEQCKQVQGPMDPWKMVKEGYIPWRIGVRPELMESIYEQCEQHAQEIDAGDVVQMSRYKLYCLLSETKFIEQDGNGPYELRPDDYFPILSERKAVAGEYFDALSKSQAEANHFMARYYSALIIELRRDYRHYCVVHTDPSKVDWQNSIHNIDEVMTPEGFIKLFSQPPVRNHFDFYEWCFDRKPKDG